jgi:hypothetical protein
MQNTSHAVMAQRHEAPDSLEDFPTPPWATRALLEHVLIPRRLYSHAQTCWEPACNSGIMAEALRPYFQRLYATDIHHYGYPWLHAVQDFLQGPPPAPRIDWIITNPPFRLALDFARRARAIAPNVALFARLSWAEGQTRYRALFRDHPESIIAPFVERAPLVKGGWDPEASSATAYAWFIWHAGGGPDTIFVRIPDGQRDGLEYDHDRRRFAKLRPAPLLGMMPVCEELRIDDEAAP